MQSRRIADDYCGSDDNNPVDGESQGLKIEATAATTFPRTRATAIAVTNALQSGYTTAFVGTDDGHLLKVSACGVTTAFHINVLLHRSHLSLVSLSPRAPLLLRDA